MASVLTESTQLHAGLLNECLSRNYLSSQWHKGNPIDLPGTQLHEAEKDDRKAAMLED